MDFQNYTTISPLVTWQNRSNPDYITTSPLVTWQNRSSPVKIKTSLAKHDVHRKWNIVIISAVSAVVCSLIFVVISLTLWRRRRTVIPRSSETESESRVPESSSHTEGESIVPESSFHTEGESIVPESSSHTEGESIVPESSSHTEGESIVPESSLCVSKKQIAPKSSDSVITPDSRISHVKELSSGQSEATSGDSIYDEDIIQEMLRINFADKIDSHGYM
ncbi:uncharacterized protein LOC134254383 [Saccostrea cucullata]|uniref:uncharacterized protein LOC134254383 n=1 Tax=Saccostrea cuccullata TaxID=36930 RepID=UPI002ED4C164